MDFTNVSGVDFTNLPVVIPYEVPDGIVVPEYKGVSIAFLLQYLINKLNSFIV